MIVENEGPLVQIDSPSMDHLAKRKLCIAISYFLWLEKKITLSLLANPKPN